MQSNTVRSYVSAIKKTLIDDGYCWQDEKVLLSSLTRACRLINDRVKTRLPIQCGLLELILFEIQKVFTSANQLYLEILYKALFALGYYGLMRVGELTESVHVVKAKDVHLATNKNKLLVVLYTSKTHGLESRPQKIKITSNKDDNIMTKRNFCPFTLLRNYLNVRGDYQHDNEQFFIYSDGTPVTPFNARRLLKGLISTLGLNSDLYDMHSLRIGRTTDLVKHNYPIDLVKRLGRWRSNIVYKYIR